MDCELDCTHNGGWVNGDISMTVDEEKVAVTTCDCLEGIKNEPTLSYFEYIPAVEQHCAKSHLSMHI